MVFCISIFLAIVVFTRLYTNAYSGRNRAIKEQGLFNDLQCVNTDLAEPITLVPNQHDNKTVLRSKEIPGNKFTDQDPYEFNENVMHQLLFGHEAENTSRDELDGVLNNTHANHSTAKYNNESTKGPFIQYPQGGLGRSELFNNRSGVHLLSEEYLSVGHCRLNVTDDHMQTALDAFVILSGGNVDDLLNLPPEYVLNSARTIAMMKLPIEKLVALWTVVKKGRPTMDITIDVLERFRPLFRYVNARQICRLNLTDHRILKYIGTHPDINRHKVGVIASKYMQLNPNWKEPKFLNMMNNLLCGVPVNFMRRLPSDVYLQLSSQVFYHINACSPLQKRFFLNMMTRTDALGKSYSWSARDVFRLGLLLTELYASNLSTISPEAMRGFTAQVMLKLPQSNLLYLSDQQVRNLPLKSLNIFLRKISASPEEFRLRNNDLGRSTPSLLLQVLVLLIIIRY